MFEITRIFIPVLLRALGSLFQSRTGPGGGARRRAAGAAVRVTVTQDHDPARAARANVQLQVYTLCPRSVRFTVRFKFPESRLPGTVAGSQLEVNSDTGNIISDDSEMQHKECYLVTHYFKGPKRNQTNHRGRPGPPVLGPQLRGTRASVQPFNFNMPHHNPNLMVP